MTSPASDRDTAFPRAFLSSQVDMPAISSLSCHPLRLLVLVLSLALSSQLAGAQEQTVPGTEQGGGTISTAEIDKLIATLENESERQAFIENLKALVEGQKAVEGDQDEGTDLVAIIAARLGRLDRQVEILANELNDGQAMLDWLGEQIADDDLRGMWLRTGLQIALILGIAIVAWLGLMALVKPQLRKLENRRHGGWVERLLLALGRMILLALPIAAFAGVAYVAMMLVAPDGYTRIVCVAIVNAMIVVRLIGVMGRSLLSPLASNLRPLPLSDEQAAYLFVWLGRFAVIGVYGYFLVNLLVAMGLPEGSSALLMRVVGLILAAMAIMLVLQSRETVANWVRSHPGGGTGRVLRQRLADIWHILACLAVLAVFVVWALDVSGGFVFLARGFGVTAVAMFAALLASTALRKGIQRLFSLSTDIRERFSGLERRSNRYVAVISIVLNIFVWAFAAIVVLEAWGVGTFAFFTTAEGAEVVSRMIAVIIVAAIAAIIWEVGDGLISRTLADGDHNPLSPRLKTLLPLARNALLVAISAIAAITVLAEIGVDIGPLLAGAGVVGIAIGFGAQTLVKDIITGAFMLFEDQFSVGDWIDVGGKSGGVESISIRTVRLRDLDGYVHTVPFGEITALTNMMRDFGFAVIDVGVAYKENTDDVLEVLRQVDAEARQDPELAERLVEELQVMGVTELGDSAVTLRIRVKTVAGYQWGVRREYLRRIKLKFDEVGIEIPFPHMTVWFGEMKGNVPPPVAHVRIDAETLPDKGEEEAQETAGEEDGGESKSENTHMLAPPGEDERT